MNKHKYNVGDSVLVLNPGSGFSEDKVGKTFVIQAYTRDYIPGEDRGYCVTLLDGSPYTYDVVGERSFCLPYPPGLPAGPTKFWMVARDMPGDRYNRTGGAGGGPRKKYYSEAEAREICDNMTKDGLGKFFLLEAVEHFELIESPVRKSIL
jgi:hypothetical protein